MSFNNKQTPFAPLILISSIVPANRSFKVFFGLTTISKVSESEANLKEGKLSVTTPIAKGLLGKKVGEKATVQVPSGVMEFEVMDITL